MSAAALAMAAASRKVHSSVISVGGSPAGSDIELILGRSDDCLCLTDLSVAAFGAGRTVAFGLGVELLLLDVLLDDVDVLESGATAAAVPGSAEAAGSTCIGSASGIGSRGPVGARDSIVTGSCACGGVSSSSSSGPSS